MTQWSKGEYSSANNKQDDLAIITSQNGFTYRSDDFDSFLLAKDLHTVSGRVELRKRKTILPPDLFNRFAALDFWTTGSGNAFRITSGKPKAGTGTTG